VEQSGHPLFIELIICQGRKRKGKLTADSTGRARDAGEEAELKTPVKPSRICFFDLHDSL
jgi:hypothetical protein